VRLLRPDAWVSILPGFAFLLLLALLAAAWFVGPFMVVALHRARIRSQPFPAAWREVLRRRMPAFKALPTDLQLQVKKHVQVLVAEKAFIGCAGQVITDEVRVLIAAQAALLLLNRPSGYFRNLRQILVYPSAFVVERSQGDELGLTHETRRALSGESWQQGQLLLSWDDVVAGAADPVDGHNVVIHEFAHQLDQERGHANGSPWLGRRDGYARWQRVLSAEFATLQRQLVHGETPPVIDPYASTNPAEFFAVVSEHFFEQPAALAAAHPALFAEFALCYRTDPLAW
jgi:hypothetical protein